MIDFSVDLIRLLSLQLNFSNGKKTLWAQKCLDSRYMVSYNYAKIHNSTSQAAKGALANRLQRCTACKIQSGHQGASKWPTGSGKVSTPRFWGAPVNFR